MISDTLLAISVVEPALAFDSKTLPGFGHLHELSTFFGGPGILSHGAAFLRVFAILLGFLHRVSWRSSGCGIGCRSFKKHS